MNRSFRIPSLLLVLVLAASAMGGIALQGLKITRTG